MKVLTVPNEWLERGALRLSARPYATGAVQTQVLLERLPVKKVRLEDLTIGHQGGVYRPPIFGMQFSRNMVSDASQGVPFLTGTSMLAEDLTTLPLVNRRLAESRKFAVLRLSEGMTLISCSGTIGRIMFVRPDMDGIWSSQDIIKVVANTALIAPGYLFAYLSSRFGVPLISQGTYGAIIQHIEREHLVDLPVPRLSDKIEMRADELVREAARKRCDASVLLAEAQSLLRAELHLPSAPEHHALSSIVDSEKLQERCDAYYFSAASLAARRAFDSARVAEHQLLGDVADVFIPPIFKRQYTESPEYGAPYITGADAFQMEANSDRLLLRRIAVECQLLLKEGMILIQEAGQLGGLIGRSVLVGRHLDGYACTNNMVRVRPRVTADTGYLFAVLNSPFGVRLLSREAAGSSIPHIELGRVKRIKFPWPPELVRQRIGQKVIKARARLDAAIDDERSARQIVESAIEMLAKGSN